MESITQELPYVEVYSTPIMGILQGTLIQLLEDDRERPILFAILTQNKYSIYLKPFTTSSEDFLEGIFDIIDNFDLGFNIGFIPSCEIS